MNENSGISLFIAEKPSVAMEFAKALNIDTSNKSQGYVTDGVNAVTWCVGHLVTMSYPEAYDPELKKWTMESLPFVPQTFKYETIKEVKKQYNIVASLLNSPSTSKIYYSGDSAREGEYIQRLIRQVAGHNPSAQEYRVWIDSQTKEEILNGIKNAHELSYYDSLSDSAYARAIEDYLVGINFSRALTLKYANIVSNAIGTDYHAIAVGRVMSCVLGMIVNKERDIRQTKIFPFYGIKAHITDDITADWKIVAGSPYKDSPDNYNNNGLLKKEPVQFLVNNMNQAGVITVIDKKETMQSKSAPLLFNLAELQAECSKLFHINPSETLSVAQKLYEAKLTTYPRTDARVLTTAICKVYDSNIRGLSKVPEVAAFSEEILTNNLQDRLRTQATKYVDDSKVSDHYAIIPTGQASGISSLSELEKSVYLLICRRFLSIFYPDAQYKKLAITLQAEKETFVSSFSTVVKEGWLKVAGCKEKDDTMMQQAAMLSGTIPATFEMKEGQSQPPKRYTSGSMILAMENAGTLIDDPDLRETIKSSGIGTSATRADTISKLEKNGYITIEKKTQTIRPAELGELIYEVLINAVPQILIPQYTASWEKGLQGIVDKQVTKDVYLQKIYGYVMQGTNGIKTTDFTQQIKASILELAKVYPNIRTSVMSDGTETIGKCPHCGGDIIYGKYGASCKNKCGMNVGRLRGVILTKSEAVSLLNGQRIALKNLKSQKGTTYGAYFTPTGIEPFSYVKKDGTTASGFQYTTTMEFMKSQSYSSKYKKK